MTISIKPVILCGGNGTRLWPLSTPEHPKQFLDLLGDETMLEMTLGRVRNGRQDRLSFSQPLVIGASRHGDLISSLAGAADILLEPFGRNSAAPVAAAALRANRDDFILVLPADQDIIDVNAFHAGLLAGASAAKEGAVVTFGIIANSPATGYGYIEAGGKRDGVMDVVRFVEKPDLDTAKSYIESGNFFWNAGIFLFRAGDMLTAFERHAPDILDAVRRALPEQSSDQPAVLDAGAFEACRSESIDYAIMEHHEALKVVPVDMGWSDIGDFRALWERSAKDDNGNVIIGDARAIDCRNCYIRSAGTPISVAGRENAVIVATDEEVLVCDLGSVQSVKALAKG